MKGILAYNRRLLQRSTAVRLSSLRPPNVRLPSIRHYTFKVSEVDIDEVPLNQYHSIADGVLEEIVDELETIGETKPDLDVELNQGVLTLELPPVGTYVINKQPAAKQIWVSSPISGPSKYDLVHGKWTYLRDGSLLGNLLRTEIAESTGVDVKFEGIDD